MSSIDLSGLRMETALQQQEIDRLKMEIQRARTVIDGLQATIDALQATIRAARPTGDSILEQLQCLLVHIPRDYA